MKRTGLIAVVMSAMFLTFSGGASAAVEFGNPCVGNQITESPNTYFPLAAIGDPLPLAAPSSGVITKWKMNSQIPASFQQTLKVVRQTGPKTVQIVGESLGTVFPGTSSTDTRISVQAGDLLGTFGTGETFEGKAIGNVFCALPGTGEVPVGAFVGAGGGPGTTNEFMLIPAEAGFPVVAVLEPDADNDGYGDETQDKCPASSATHDACPPPPVTPPVGLSASATTKRGSAKILVTTSAQASVTVVGKVALGKGKTAKLNGGTKLISPGTLGAFTLLFPKALKEKLKALSPKRSLTLKVTATAPNSAGVVATKQVNVKLKGQAKPANAKASQHKG